jgi:hypothetical protein
MKDLDEAFLEGPIWVGRGECDTRSQTSVVILLTQCEIFPSLVYKPIGAVSPNVCRGTWRLKNEEGTYFDMAIDASDTRTGE